MPGTNHHIFNEKLDKYFMPSNLSEKWLRVDQDLFDHIGTLQCTGSSDSRNAYSVSHGPSSQGPVNP